MGHLINAKAFRLGWFHNWHDSWYSNYILYPEYLYISLRIRLYLYFFFRNRLFIRRSIIYSHFETSITNVYLTVSVYLYDARIGYSLLNLLKQFRKRLPKKLRKTHRKFGSKDLLRVWRIIILLRFFGVFGDDFFFQKKSFYWFLYDFVKSFNSTNMETTFTDISSILKINFSRATLLFCVFLSRVVHSYAINLNEKTGLDESVFKRICFLLFSYFSYKHTIENMGKCVSVVAQYFAGASLKYNPMHFFLISEDSINASLLSRFFAVKFRQNFTIRDLYKPIKKELSILRKRFRPLGFLGDIRGQSRKFEGSYKFFNIFWLYYFYYTNYNKNKYYLNYNWLSCDKLILNIWMRSTFAEEKNLMTFSWFIYRNERSFSFLLLFNDNNWSIFNNIANIDFLNMGSSIIDYTLLRVFTTYMAYVNYSVISSTSFNSNWNAGYLKFVNYHVNDFMRIRYYNYCYEFDASARGFNNLRLRDFHPYDLWAFRGFKFQFCGRFSRKQRASFMWYRLGRLPLNTVIGNIDYNFHVVPLRNSSVCIKIWLFKATWVGKYTIQLS